MALDVTLSHRAPDSGADPDALLIAAGALVRQLLISNRPVADGRAARFDADVDALMRRIARTEQRAILSLPGGELSQHPTLRRLAGAHAGHG